MLAVRLDKKYERTNVLWNQLFIETLNLGQMSLATFVQNPSFPELSYNYIKFLRKLQKEFRFIVYKMQIKANLRAIEETLARIRELRK